jgi:hypothetical protein
LSSDFNGNWAWESGAVLSINGAMERVVRIMSGYGMAALSQRRRSLLIAQEDSDAKDFHCRIWISIADKTVLAGVKLNGGHL